MDKDNMEIKENNEDDSGNEFIDLVKNQKPQAFGDAISLELGNMARSNINDLKSDEYGDVNLGEHE